MRALIQRVSQAEVQVAGERVGHIADGLLVLLGVQRQDNLNDVYYLASKLVNLRIFEDKNGKMNHDVRDHQGAILVVSQFTLYADCRKGRRPSFIQAAAQALAQELYEAFITEVTQLGVAVAQGRFGAHMTVSLINDGPVTILLESPEKPAGDSQVKK